MKKLFTFLLVIAFCFSGCTYGDTELAGRVENLENRVTALEKLCKEMNSNISALQTIVEALQNNDYVTGVMPAEENGKVVGYTITFVKSSPIVIYHGQDGVNGSDGTDGYTPIIGVEQDSEGIYYWTLDGKWLTDSEGNKIKAEGIDGKDGTNGSDGKDGTDGENGKDGQNGTDGANGKDGITPQLKIENNYWHISYDNGTSWTLLSKATGENGANGADGKDGADGDSFFQDVDMSSDDYVIFTLADGSQIKLPTWYAFEQIKQQCEEMNKNIVATQQILESLQNNDYATSIQQIVENGKTIGYTINFSKSGAVTIYHGADGKDGQSPVVGVRKDTDDIYYWTLDGEWLTDEGGNKIKAVGIDGKDGVDGEDGKDGTDGTDGNNGITPLLKIENGYWYISYDKGSSWTLLGKATSEDGADGSDGKDGDSFFQSIDTSDKNYVTLILIDGTTIKVPTWYAFEELQKMCNQMNTNITSLQTIVAALQDNDYVTSVTPVVEGGKTIGYTINFSKSDAVTIYHGADGKDGINGENGLDGHSPQIGVRQDSDGIYYWTLDGEWLTDESGNKIKAVGIDGKDGIDGEDGINGIDGITPLLKIENGYWYISYDKGVSWTLLGKATSEDGTDGKDGDSFFQSIDTSDKNYVTLILIDGTTIKVPTWYAFEELQNMCNQMNTNITSLQTIVAALQNNDYVTSVTPIVEGGKTIGYTISFSKSGAVTIYHGQDGTNGHTPIIGVQQDADGLYYWTLDGGWLTDAAGNKIKAVGEDGENGAPGTNGSNGINGKDGITPQLKIENNYWHISDDKGVSWAQLGKATGEDGKDGTPGAPGEDGTPGENGDSFFQSVTQDSQYVYFTLADETTITVPKGAMLDIAFAESDLVVMSPNSTREIAYAVQSVTEKVVVEVTSSADIKAKVVTTDATGKSGKIVITTTAAIDEYSKVIVFVSNDEKVIMRSISFEPTGLEVADSALQSISAYGGNLQLNFLTNMDWTVEIPASAKSWITVAPQTRAMTAYTATLEVQPNTTLAVRSAEVKIATTDGKLAVTYTISQGVFNSIIATTPEYSGWLADASISMFAGNTKNQKFTYNGTVSAASGEFVAAVVSSGTPTAVSAHYAVYPYSANHSLGANGKITTTFAAAQSYVAGGFRSDYNTMVAISSGVNDTNLTFKPVCAYLRVKLWGDDQTLKSITLSSNNNEPLAGKAVVTPSRASAPTCVMTGTATEITLNCNEVTLGSSKSSATEFWIVVPSVALAKGYSLKVEGFYGGEQTVTISDAVTLVAGNTYDVSAEVSLSGSGIGSGIGGWGDGGENGGTAE